MPSITSAGPNLKVAYVSAETEHCLVGGLGEVTKSLPQALRTRGIEVTRFTPLYGIVRQSAGDRLTKIPFSTRPEVSLFGQSIPVSAFALRGASVPTVYFKDTTGKGESRDFQEEGIHSSCPGNYLLSEALPLKDLGEACFSKFFFDDRVYPKGADMGANFLFASKAVLELIKSGLFGAFDIIHFQDWHFALIPTLIKFDRRYQGLARIATAGTVHNYYSWACPPEQFEAMSGLSKAENPELYAPWHGLLHENQMHFIKGFQHADMVNTVSPTFARELFTSNIGNGFSGFFKFLFDTGRFTGILNGIDASWDPVTDGYIAAKFAPSDCSGKAGCKLELRKVVGLSNHTGSPIVGVLSRFTPEKGFDILLPALSFLVNSGAQFAFFGSGDDDFGYQARLKSLCCRHPGKVACLSGLQNLERLSHLLYAGSDLFVRPSFYEPCGLSQMIAMKYGAVPIVRKTGGLADTVIDFDQNPPDSNGFSFEAYTAPALRERIERALRVFNHDPTIWRNLMLRGMQSDFSWRRSAALYVDLYRRAMENARAQRAGIKRLDGESQ